MVQEAFRITEDMFDSIIGLSENKKKRQKISDNGVNGGGDDLYA